jgi:AcrR family transcriptional regulator
MNDAAVSKTDRREALKLKAEELFATKGIDAVSLNEINKATGQRNTSALHYHFGSKEGLIEAIVYERYEMINQQLNTLLDEFEALAPQQQTLRALLKASVRPFTDQLDEQRGIYYLLIVTQLFMKSSDMITKGHPSGQDTARLRLFRLYKHVMAELPAEVQNARLILHASLLFHSLATYAQTVQPKAKDAGAKKTLFFYNLLDALEGLMQSPVSTETLAAIQESK